MHWLRHPACIRGICKMMNAVGRDIPEEILRQTGKEVFQGVHHFDGYTYKKHGPMTQCVINSGGSKLVESIHEVLVKCGIRDGMTLGFHHQYPVIGRPGKGGGSHIGGKA
mgnify:CR=1 FL=1